MQYTKTDYSKKQALMIINSQNILENQNKYEKT